MRFNGDAYSKLFPRHDETEKRVESVVEDVDDDSGDDVIEDNNVSEDEPNDLVD